MVPKAILLVLSGLLVCYAAPKTTLVSNEIPKVDVDNGEVSASFGGYQASAGLGGIVSGGPAGGLHAEASVPGGPGASAGLGGSVGGDSSATSSASSGSSVGNRVYVPQKPRQRPPEFYDNVFNIPISVLQAVNQFLGGGAAASKHGTGASVQTRASTSTSANANSDAVSGPEITLAGTSAHTGATASKGGFFDQIFNIPISALRSVNQLLNNKNQQTG